MKEKNAGKINKCVMLNLIQHLRRLSFQRALHNNMRGRSRIKYGMTSLYNSGFTLIELLVVVLIIGILAAVALPQYQKAVDRARAVEVTQLISTLQQATERWILENPGKAVTDLLNKDSTDRLDIDIPCQCNEYGECFINKNWFFVKSVDDKFIVGASLDSNTYDWVTIVALRDENGQWTHKCGYSGEREKSICIGLQGYYVEEGSDW